MTEPKSDPSSSPGRSTEPPTLARRRTQQGMRAVDLTSIGLVFPVAMFLGYWVGGVIGGWLGYERPGQLVGGALGIVSGFYNVYKVVLRLNAEIVAEDRKIAAEDREAADA